MENDDLVTGMEEIKSKIQELQDGLMEIATTVGKLKGELKVHKEKADAHSPLMLGKDVN